MAITINPSTYEISIPQSDLTFVSGTLYSADTNAIRLAIKVIEASEAGIVLPTTNIHNTEVTVAGTTFARTIEYISPYSLTFTPDSQWTVRLEGSNNNMFDVENGILNQNQVQVISTNSAGLIVSGGGNTPTEIAGAVWNAATSSYQQAGSMGEAQAAASLTEQDKLDIADRVWDEATADHNTAGSMGEAQQSPALNPQEVADAVWDEPTTNHTTAGTTGKALIDAGAAGNPWDTPISSSNTEGTFGYLLQTTFVNYFNNIITSIANLSRSTINRLTGSQPNQK